MIVANPYVAGAMGALQVWSGFQQANFMRQSSELNQRIAELNAEFIEQDAWEAEKFGYTQIARYEPIANQQIEDQRLAMSIANVDMTQGTGRELLEQSRLNKFFNTLEMQNRGRAAALGLKQQASNVRLQAFMSGVQTDMNAYSAQMSGILSGIQTSITGYGGK